MNRATALVNQPAPPSPPQRTDSQGGAGGWLPSRLRNSPYWVISILLHLGLLFLATVLVVFNVMRPGGVEGGFYDGGGNEGVDVAPPPAQTQQMAQMQNQPTTASQSFSQLTQAIATTGVGEWSIAAPTDVAAGAAAASISGVGRGIPGAYSGRIGAGNRLGLLRKRGGSQSVEDAVNKALEWLRRNQNEDGSWGEDYKPAMTGLAILCYLAHGDVQGSDKYGSVVERGVNWLIAEGRNRNGLMSSRAGKAAYQHAIASLALAENYALAPTVPDLEEAATKAIALIVKNQQDNGQWSYEYERSGGHPDTSIAGWNMQALKAAHLGQLNVEGVEAALERSAKMLKQMYNDSVGSFGYQSADNNANWEKRGLGVYNLQLLLDKIGDDGKPEWQNTREVTRSLDAFLKDNNARFDWDRSSGWVLYGWYYNTYMTFFAGAQYWSTWNGQFREPLIRRQERDGRWALPPGENGWTLQVLNKNLDADVYSTAMCCLMLQVFWRHLVTG